MRERSDAGLSHIPEDRHRRGLVLDYSIADNLILGRQHHFTKRGVLDRRAIASNGNDRVRRIRHPAADATLPAGALSGGNQQKVVIAREMGREFSVLLAAQPTRGVDVGAIEFIHARIRAAARTPDKASCSSPPTSSRCSRSRDRIAVMYDGRFVVRASRARRRAPRCSVRT